MHTSTSITPGVSIDHAVFEQRTETVTMRIDGEFEEITLGHLRAFVDATAQLDGDTPFNTSEHNGVETLNATVVTDCPADSDDAGIDYGDKPNPPNPDELFARKLVRDRLARHIHGADVWGLPGLGDLDQAVVDRIVNRANSILADLAHHIPQ